MDSKAYIRNAEKVHSQLKELENGSLVTKDGCKIYFPCRFTERSLGEVGVEVRVVGLYAIVVEDLYYAVCNINASMRLTPSAVNKVKFGSEDFYECVFDKGAVVIPSLELVKQDVLVYRIYDELFSKGNVPWYIGYEDLGNIFDTAKYHANANVGKSPEVTQLLVSLISRDPSDRTKYYRTAIKSRKDLVDKQPAYIPLKSVTYAATNTTNKLAGSYFAVGVKSALVDPADRTEKIEEILRR